MASPASRFPRAESEFWRLRDGELRVIYAIDDAHGLVVVLKVARRSESTYRRLP